MSLNIYSLLSSERRMPITLGLVFLPWVGVVLFTAGIWAAFNILAYAIVVFAAGYSIVSFTFPGQNRVEAFVLTPAVGILTVSALTAFWVRLGLPLFWTPLVWLALMAAGALCLLSDRTLWAKSTVTYGGALIILSLLICTVYLLPGARKDAVLQHDGSFNWMYVDTQYNYSMAAALKSGGSPPKEPGTATQELLYHFGGYAPSAAISRFDGLNLGDAYARVTRGASLWALVLSCFGVGTLLSLKATGEKFGGIMSVAGLFFYGSLLALFTDERNSSSYVTGAILFKIPEAMVGHDGGPFSHLILGHSELHALCAITGIMGLCLVQRQRGTVLTWRGLILLMLPAFAITMHSVAGLYCIGAVGILLFWGRLGEMRSWLFVALMFFFFLAAWKIMGYSHAPDATESTIRLELAGQWGTLTSAFAIGLGLRILGFRWISQPLSDPISALVLATVLGFLTFFLVVHLKGGEEIYGVFFLQSMFSIFAFSRLTPGWWHVTERSQWAAEWLRLAIKGMIILLVFGVVLRLTEYATHSQVRIASFRLQILPLCALTLLLAVTLTLMNKNLRFSALASGMVAAVLLIGFLAWIPPWLNFGMGRMRMDVTLAPGEVQGLNRLSELAARDDRFATNKHSVDALAMHRDRSYAYAALSERPVLLEGLQYHTPADSQWFKDLLRDNDLLFTTTDPETLRSVAKTWHVRWLVARPGTDITVPRPLPAWLVEQQDSGDLKIYRVD